MMEMIILADGKKENIFHKLIIELFHMIINKGSLRLHWNLQFISKEFIYLHPSYSLCIPPSQGQWGDMEQLQRGSVK